MSKTPAQDAAAGWWEKLTTGAGFGVVITLCVVLAGVVASLYPEAIRSFTYPIIGSLPKDASELRAGAWWFGSLLIAALVLVLINQSNLYRKSGREQGALSNTLVNLEDQQTLFNKSLDQLNSAVQRLNTLPSQSFLPAFRDSYREAFELTLGCIGTDADVRTTEIAIRAVLGAIIETAKDFDGAAQESVYGANIMLFRHRASPPYVTDTLGLVTVTAGHAEYIGALELIPELSTSSAAPWNEDRKTKPIALPVPADSHDYFDQGAGETRQVVLPGAPTSFVKRSFDAYPSIDVFVKALRGSALQDTWVGQIVNYFTNLAGEGRHIRSFASLPIEHTIAKAVGAKATDAPSPDKGKGLVPAAKHPLAVLNIHSEEPGLLADNGGSLFAPLMGPFSSLLAILIVQRQAKLAAGAGASSGAPNGGQPQKGEP